MSAGPGCALDEPWLIVTGSAGDAELRKLDSSVKRNTATLNKLRKLSDEAGPAVLEDLKKVNQSKVRQVACASRSKTSGS